MRPRPRRERTLADVTDVVRRDPAYGEVGELVGAVGQGPLVVVEIGLGLVQVLEAEEERHGGTSAEGATPEGFRRQTARRRSVCRPARHDSTLDHRPPAIRSERGGCERRRRSAIGCSGPEDEPVSSPVVARRGRTRKRGPRGVVGGRMPRLPPEIRRAHSTPFGLSGRGQKSHSVERKLEWRSRVISRRMW